jgi:hypothetical protein
MDDEWNSQTAGFQLLAFGSWLSSRGKAASHKLQAARKQPEQPAVGFWPLAFGKQPGNEL